MTTTDKGWSWVILAASFGCSFLMFGTLSGGGVLYVATLDLFTDTSHLEVIWILFLMQICLNFMGPVAGYLGQRFTYRKTAMIGGFLASIGLFACFFASSVQHLYASFSLIYGVGLGLVVVPHIVVVNLAFEKHRGLANGIFSAGASVGCFVVPPVLEVLNEYYGLMGLFLVWSGVILHIVAFGAVYRPVKKTQIKSFETELLRKTKTDDNCVNNGNKASKSRLQNRLSYLSFLGKRYFWMIAFGWSGTTFGISCFAVIIVDFATMQSQEITRTNAAFLVSFWAIGDLLGRLGCGFILDKKWIKLEIFYIFSMILSSMSVAVMQFIVSYTLLAVCSFVFGLALGAAFVQHSLLLIATLGLKTFQRAFGYLSISAGTMLIGLTLLVGVLRDVTHSHHCTFTLIGVMLLLPAVFWVLDITLHHFRRKQELQIDAQDDNNVKRPSLIRLSLMDFRTVPPDGGWGWMIVLSTWLINLLIFGLFRAGGIILVECGREFQNSHSMRAWIPVLNTGLAFFLSPFSGYLVRKYGYRQVVFAGGIFCSFGLAICYFANNINYVLLGYGVFLGSGLGLALNPNLSIVGLYFQKRRALATGISFSGGAFGVFIMGPLLERLIDEYSLKGTFLILSAILLHICVGATLFQPIESHLVFIPDNQIHLEVSPPPRIQTRGCESNGNVGNNRLNGYCTSPVKRVPLACLDDEFLLDESSVETAARVSFGLAHGPIVPRIVVTTAEESVSSVSLTSIEVAPKEKFDFSLLFNELLLLVSIGYGICLAAYVGVTVILPDYIQNEIAGKSKTMDGYLCVMVAAIGDTIGRLMIGWFIDRLKHRKQRLYHVCIFTLGLTISILPFIANYNILITLCFFIGLIYGICLVHSPCFLAEFFGADKLSWTMGFMLTITGIPILCLGPIIGAIKENTGTYKLILREFSTIKSWRRGKEGKSSLKISFELMYVMKPLSACKATDRTHPSIRIVGTETNYSPIQCMDLSCTNKNPHMHCPFCQKTEFYTDPIILRAHYRVKHVDKGIDFAGLKVLRCCDLCDIVGAIKGEKKFKGAHWHCYKCKNGFNRRDEAIKHYKTHFRNPQTTFQIHIAQEVNNPVQLCENQEIQNFAQNDVNATVHPVFTEAINSNRISNNENDSFLANGPPNLIEYDHIHASIGANETVGSVNDLHQPNREDEQKNIKEWRMREEMYVEKERQLMNEIEGLKSQVEKQAAEISALRKRENQLIDHIQFPSNCKLQELMNNLQNQHLELLQQQILQTLLPGSAPPNDALNSLGDETTIALVMDQSGNLLPLNQPEISSTDRKLQSDSLVIIDWNDEMKKREADIEDSIMTDNKRKK
uniref:C2H2-type domain-containing protein n=1 Tax=Strigamia maritima TaxID=126957 RepID=T1J6I2_STRMM